MALCSTRFLLFLLLISAIPIAILVSLELAKPSTHVYYYHSSGWFRDCAKWDDGNRRFLVSFMDGGVGQILVPDYHSPDAILQAQVVVQDVDITGNSSLGLLIDRPRNRFLVVIADVIGKEYGAVAAYDLSTFRRLFLTQLSDSRGEKFLADDIAVDENGNAYVTNAWGSMIWKVGEDGKLLSTIKSPLFTPKEWFKSLVGLNGIVHHPNGYLLVVHTSSGNLFKIDLNKGQKVTLIYVNGGSLMFGDGLELISPIELVVAGPTTRLVESKDGWETASVVATFSGPKHRLATAATVKDGKVYLSYMVGMGYPKKKHAIVEAVFSA